VSISELEEWSSPEISGVLHGWPQLPVNGSHHRKSMHSSIWESTIIKHRESYSYRSGLQSCRLHKWTWRMIFIWSQKRIQSDVKGDWRRRTSRSREWVLILRPENPPFNFVMVESVIGDLNWWSIGDDRQAVGHLAGFGGVWFFGRRCFGLAGQKPS
jgi:hypothetical protein